MPTLRTLVSSCLFIGVSLSDVLEHEFWAYSTPITSQGSIHLPYSLQGLWSTWCFYPLPQSPEPVSFPPFLEWVFQGTGCVVSAFPSSCLLLILNCSSTSLIRRQGGGVGGQSLRLGFPYLEKRTWLNCQILRPERQQPHHVQVSVCLLTDTVFLQDHPPRSTWSFRAPLPAQQRKQFNTGLWAMLTSQNWSSEKPECVIGYLSI